MFEFRLWQSAGNDMSLVAALQIEFHINATVVLSHYDHELVSCLCHQLHTVKAHTFRVYTQTLAIALQGQQPLSKAVG